MNCFDKKVNNRKWLKCQLITAMRKVTSNVNNKLKFHLFFRRA
jgi:hypothetical protein